MKLKLKIDMARNCLFMHRNHVWVSAITFGKNGYNLLGRLFMDYLSNNKRNIKRLKKLCNRVY